MEQEARDPAGADPVPDDRDRGSVAGGRSELDRLRRENRRLEARLESEERRRERLIDRYEALLPDGSQRPDPAGTPGVAASADRPADSGEGDETGVDTADRGVASAVGYAVWRGVTWGRRRLRAFDARR